MSTPDPTVWPVLHYDDTDAALRFLVDALGFREALSVRDEDGDVVHAELRWPTGGGAEVVQAPHETVFGAGVETRAFTVRDPEGNLWTFGTYRGAA